MCDPRSKEQGGLSLLFSQRYRTRTLLASVPWFLMDIATYGVGLFTPVILGAIHLSSSTAGPLVGEYRQCARAAPRSICFC